jgi:hypothetical protein
VTAFYGQFAEEATPSRELIKASLDDAAYTFTAVSARDVPTILDTVLERIDCSQLAPILRTHRRDRSREVNRGR